jgi:hypothetical protein
MGFEQIRKAALVPGKLVPLKLDMLPGSPVIWVEHLGEENATWINARVAAANAAMQSRGKKKVTVKDLKATTEERRQEIIDRAIRNLDAVHDNGTPATKTDIPMFGEALPPDVVDLVWAFAYNAANWRDAIEGDPKELSEK